MSEMKTVPVFKCNRCGRNVRVTHLSTAEPDYDGEQLFAMMRNLNKITLCNECQAKRNWMMRNGRQEDWEKGL